MVSPNQGHQSRIIFKGEGNHSDKAKQCEAQHVTQAECFALRPGDLAVLIKEKALACRLHFCWSLHAFRLKARL